MESIRASSLRLRRLSARSQAVAEARLRAAIDAHLNYVQEHGPVYAAIYRSGVAIAPEVNDILEEHRRSSPVLPARLGRRPARARAARRPARLIAMVEGASLDWIAHPDASPATSCASLLIAGYAAMLGKAMELDPKALPLSLLKAAAAAAS